MEDNQIGGIIMLLASCFFIGLGIHTLRKGRRLKKTGIAVTGEVLHVVKRKSHDSSPVMVVRFRTLEGEEHIVDYPNAPYAKGESFELLYNPKKPAEIELTDPPVINGILPYIFIVIGAFGMLMAIAAFKA